ncbi:MAG: gamma-glutamyl-gamma-aminobutyrate hydrolase family protein [Oscillospiraceae bacterium]|nr:gamma-glutamyl-gamma-aminobutyrate hydrolase family protein [Oscillospiraceae bacterium]
MAETVFIWGEEAEYANYAAALRSCGATPVFSKDIDCSDTCGALLLPGGGDIHPKYYDAAVEDCRGLDEERDAAEWELMTRFTRSGRPILGVCRGMQVLNVFFGGTLRQHVEGHGGLADGSDSIHETRAADGSLFSCWWGDDFFVNSNHHQAVGTLAPCLRPLQKSKDGVVEAFSHGALPVLGVEWHPERQMSEGRDPRLVDGTLIYRYFLSLCDWEAP